MHPCHPLFDYFQIALIHGPNIPDSYAILLLQHWTLLLSLVTSKTGYCFCFCSIPSFFLVLFLHWSPVAYWAMIMEKAREFQKNISFCFIDCANAFDCVDHNKLWKILQKIRTDHLTCLLRNLYTGQETTELDMEQQTGSNLGNECAKATYCHAVYLTYMQSTSC